MFTIRSFDKSELPNMLFIVFTTKNQPIIGSATIGSATNDIVKPKFVNLSTELNKKLTSK
uniref:Uncharacterized protein n=1 Tax=Romanomermis culicivorax TaxID=13658 RepID=A0A915JSB6_ROMCU